jgi:hypothetical protein
MTVRIGCVSFVRLSKVRKTGTAARCPRQKLMTVMQDICEHVLSVVCYLSPSL